MGKMLMMQIYLKIIRLNYCINKKWLYLYTIKQRSNNAALGNLKQIFMEKYKRTLLDGREDIIDTEKCSIPKETWDIMAENEQEANEIVQRHRVEYPDQERDTIPYVKILD